METSFFKLNGEVIRDSSKEGSFVFRNGSWERFGGASYLMEGEKISESEANELISRSYIVKNSKTIILDVLRYTVLIICVIFFILLMYFTLVGLFSTPSAPIDEDYIPGETYPY